MKTTPVNSVHQTQGTAYTLRASFICLFRFSSFSLPHSPYLFSPLFKFLQGPSSIYGQKSRSMFTATAVDFCRLVGRFSQL